MKSLKPMIAALMTLQSGISVSAKPIHTTQDTAAVNPQIILLAREWFHRFQADEVDRTQLDTLVNRQLTESVIRAEAIRLKKLGTPTRFVYEKMEQNSK